MDNVREYTSTSDYRTDIVLSPRESADMLKEAKDTYAQEWLHFYLVMAEKSDQSIRCDLWEKQKTAFNEWYEVDRRHGFEDGIKPVNELEQKWQVANKAVEDYDRATGLLDAKERKNKAFDILLCLSVSGSDVRKAGGDTRGQSPQNHILEAELHGSKLLVEAIRENPSLFGKVLANVVDSADRAGFLRNLKAQLESDGVKEINTAFRDLNAPLSVN